MPEQLDLKSFAGMGQIPSIFSMYLPDVIDKHPEIRVLSSDMSYGARLDRFKAYNSNKFINVGIAEQNLIGVATGIASEGFKCIAFAQAAFITMRSYEQVRQYMSYMGYPIIIIGLSSGLSMQFMGNTHYAIEDIAIMKILPNMVVMAPADSGEAVKAFQYALTLNKPVYIRLNGCPDASTVYENDFDYTEKANVLKQGNDVSLFATGSLVSAAIRSAHLIESTLNITVKVVDMHTVKPLDEDVIKISKNSKLLVSLEEHFITGGLGSSISDYIAMESGFPPILKLGIKDQYSKVGDYQYLINHHRLTPELITEDIISKYITL